MSDDIKTREVMPSQAEDRQGYLDQILESRSGKKLIVAGPGTGKTYTFKKMLYHLGPGKYLILSFIRKLVDDIAVEMGEMAEVKTFHAFCKRILHELQGKVDIYPSLPEIIQEDAMIHGYDYKNVENKFRNLEEASPEIKFFITRGDYYKYLSFDDSVYRLYQLLKTDDSILGHYDQIIVDEYQDFNLLEVGFLNEFEKKGPILMAGDDDQAIYKGRASSPDYLREKYESCDYERFELPYCSRCPEVIVNAANAFIEQVIVNGGLKGRINKLFLPFTAGQEEINRLYPKIKVIEVSVISAIAKYLVKEIQKIPTKEIIESNHPDLLYPTVLIIGQSHYLSELKKKLEKHYPQVEFDKKSQLNQSRLLDGIEILKKEENSNLGWRIVAGELLDQKALNNAVIGSQNLNPFKDFLDGDFKQSILEVINLIKKVKQEKRGFSRGEKQLLETRFPKDSDYIINFYSPLKKESLVEQDPEKPTILLRTFEGSKGLSGGHVFIVGAHNGSMPKIEDDEINDIECCKFIVALTRTRKQCHIVSNKWLNSPINKNGVWEKSFEKSIFVDFIPENYIENLGYKKSGEL